MSVQQGSVAASVRRSVLDARPGAFFRRQDFDGTDRAVESALSRLAAEGELLRVRRGLYWRGKATRFGMTRPSPFEVALAVAGPGAGPSGVAAAHLLGLTTQVPSVVDVAVAGKTPEPIEGIRFRSRPFERRQHDLRPTEVAILEVLRQPSTVEVPWPAAARRIREVLHTTAVRRDVVIDEAISERNRGARERALELAASA